MSQYKEQIVQGMKEARAGIERLQSLWPAAFPCEPHLVRPLDGRLITREIMEGTGWTAAYVRGVLSAWRMRAAYCKAILRYDQRVNLRGEKSDQPVLDDARATARERLEAIDARRRKQKERDRLRLLARQEKSAPDQLSA
jgi:hypothetical protein